MCVFAEWSFGDNLSFFFYFVLRQQIFSNTYVRVYTIALIIANDVNDLIELEE